MSTSYLEQELATLLALIDDQFEEDICLSNIDTNQIDLCVALLKGIYADGVQFANECAEMNQCKEKLI